MGNWHVAVDEIQEYVVRLATPSGSGTGFFFYASETTDLVAVATCAHVLPRLPWWERPEPIQLTLIRPADQSVVGQRILHPFESCEVHYRDDMDTAVIYFNRGDFPFPQEQLPTLPVEKVLKVGVEIGWLGFPGVAPPGKMCFFQGHVSAWIDSDKLYIVDGVAINGVSGGPVFWRDESSSRVQLIGIISAYIPNVREDKMVSPGVSVVRNIDQLHQEASGIRSMDDARREAPPVDDTRGQAEDATESRRFSKN